MHLQFIKCDYYLLIICKNSYILKYNLFQIAGIFIRFDLKNVIQLKLKNKFKKISTTSTSDFYTAKQPELIL